MNGVAQTVYAYAGHLVMGDATYNHIYNGTDSTGSVTQRLRTDTAASPGDDAAADMNVEAEQEARDVSVSPGGAGEGGIDALHEAIVSNTDNSAAILEAAATPTGIGYHLFMVSVHCPFLCLSLVLLAMGT